MMLAFQVISEIQICLVHRRYGALYNEELLGQEDVIPWLLHEQGCHVKIRVTFTSHSSFKV